MSHRPHLDRYQRLASQLPMRDPVAGPDQLRTLGPRALVGALQGGARYGEALLDASEEAWTEYLDYIANEHPAFYVGDEGGSRSAACRATGIGVVPEVRGA